MNRHHAVPAEDDLAGTAHDGAAAIGVVVEPVARLRLVEEGLEGSHGVVEVSDQVVAGQVRAASDHFLAVLLQEEFPGGIHVDCALGEGVRGNSRAGSVEEAQVFRFAICSCGGGEPGMITGRHCSSKAWAPQNSSGSTRFPGDGNLWSVGVRKNVLFAVAIPPAGSASDRSIRTVNVEIPVRWEEELGDWLLTEEAHRIIEETKAREMGLLSPEQLKALRERFGYTQKQMARLFQIGEKSWTRWETGRQRPTRVINLLIRALADGEISADYLREKAAMMLRPGEESPYARIFGSIPAEESDEEFAMAVEEFS